jgi:hypothetical protein
MFLVNLFYLFFLALGLSYLSRPPNWSPACKASRL